MYIFSVSEITENEKYSVGFISGTRHFNLEVILPTNFPTDKPKLTISPIVDHSWVQGITGEITDAPGLISVIIHLN